LFDSLFFHIAVFVGLKALLEPLLLFCTASASVVMMVMKVRAVCIATVIGCSLMG
jgi:hypothetical protein